MKKIFIMLCLIVTMLVISACGGASATQDQANGNPPGGAASQTGSTTGEASKDNTKYLDVSYSNALSLPMQLIVGTLKLKGTENEVDAETAKQLLPLWKAVKALGNNDTTSPIEIEAVYKQIQRTMTEEQIAAIADMNLTSDNMMQISQELGLAMGGGAGMGTMSAEQKSTIEAERASGGSGTPAGGGMMGGGPGGGEMPGGGMMGGEVPVQATTSETTEESRAPKVSQVDSTLVEAVVEYLKSRMQ